MKLTEKHKDVLIKLGLHIREIRMAKNIKLSELSAKTGIRKEYLQKIENGIAFGVLLDRHIVRISNALQMKLSEFLDF